MENYYQLHHDYENKRYVIKI